MYEMAAHRPAFKAFVSPFICNVRAGATQAC
jgi:hypothetical protein